MNDEAATGCRGAPATDEHHHLAGHAFEGSSTHVVMATAFDRFDRLVANEAIAPGLHVVDHDLGTVP